jgi:hypothetical protein
MNPKMLALAVATAVIASACGGSTPGSTTAAPGATGPTTATPTTSAPTTAPPVTAPAPPAASTTTTALPDVLAPDANDALAEKLDAVERAEAKFIVRANRCRAGATWVRCFDQAYHRSKVREALDDLDATIKSMTAQVGTGQCQRALGSLSVQTRRLRAVYMQFHAAVSVKSETLWDRAVAAERKAVKQYHRASDNVVLTCMA